MCRRHFVPYRGRIAPDIPCRGRDFLVQPVVGEIKKPSTWRLTNGTEISHYKIIEPIGVGGMGEVYLADDLRLNRQVSVQDIARADLADRDRLRRFQREADVSVGAESSKHPDDLRIWYRVTYIFSPPNLLRARHCRGLAERGRLGISESLDIALQVASALMPRTLRALSIGT